MKDPTVVKNHIRNDNRTSREPDPSHMVPATLGSVTSAAGHDQSETEGGWAILIFLNFLKYLAVL